MLFYLFEGLFFSLPITDTIMIGPGHPPILPDQGLDAPLSQILPLLFRIGRRYDIAPADGPLVFLIPGEIQRAILNDDGQVDVRLVIALVGLLDLLLRIKGGSDLEKAIRRTGPLPGRLGNPFGNRLVINLFGDLPDRQRQQFPGQSLPAAIENFQLGRDRAIDFFRKIGTNRYGCLLAFHRQKRIDEQSPDHIILGGNAQVDFPFRRFGNGKNLKQHQHNHPIQHSIFHS
ncbi:MAG: hypothetical protein BWY71_01700 [Planctomycetes bacterium ADurb.Bin412]|nr:MAG: hypothetical protein BWY71_01700 [Planctomycetes bacterium ADurb.Bin412]